MLPCLWGEVAEKLSTEDDRARALSLVKSEDFLRVVQRFRRTEGIAPHPAVAYRILLDESTLAKWKVSTRASTPRQKRKASAGVGRGRGTHERPSALKRRARRPLHEAARSAYASTLGDAQREAGAVGRSTSSAARRGSTC